jgi:hypothetical protein
MESVENAFCDLVQSAKRTRLCWVFAWAFVLSGMAAPARAQDRIVLQRGSHSGRVIVSGTIEDYTGAEVTIRPHPDDTAKKYPASEVSEIHTTRSPPHSRGLEHLARRECEAAIREFDAALRNEQRTWVRREILALTVRAALRRGDYTTAGTRFLILFKSDPQTRHFGLIPLAWAPDPNAAAARRQAQEWLTFEAPPARLLGASLLYEDAQLSREARSALKDLASSTDARIRLLAQAQNWRREALSGSAVELEISQWHERINAYPADLRAGPSFLLGKASALRHDYELAAAAFLWQPLVDDHDARLAARACLEAAAALATIGQQVEARTLLSETIGRYPDTPAAQNAQKLIHPPSPESPDE